MSCRAMRVGNGPPRAALALQSDEQLPKAGQLLQRNEVRIVAKQREVRQTERRGALEERQCVLGLS